MDSRQFRTGVINPIECVKEGFELIKSDYWLLFAVTLVGMLIGGFTMDILLGAMLCGMFYAYLNKIDGRPVSFDDLWKGMGWFVPGLVVVLVIVVPMIFFYVGVYISMIGALVLGSQIGQGAVTAFFFGALALDVVFVILMVCFHTLLMFAFPLIVDRNLGPVAAMTTSARAVWRNLGGVAGLIGVNFVLAILGYMALCVGVYFVVPVMIAGNVVAYRRVFPSLQNNFQNQAGYYSPGAY